MHLIEIWIKERVAIYLKILREERLATISIVEYSIFLYVTTSDTFLKRKVNQ